MRNIENEILELQKRTPAFESGFMPVARELRAAGRRDLDNAITKMGGYAKVAVALGLTRSSGKRSAGFWRDFANLESALRTFLKENATEAGEQTMPTQKELRRLGRSDIESALEQHGGTAEVAKKLGLALASSKKPKHYWKDWTKVEAEVMHFVNEREAAQLASRSVLPTAVIPRVARMPSQKELRAAGKGDLAEAISSYHGGFRIAASKLGLISKKKDDHYYDHFYNVALEIYALVAAVGSESIMPSTAVLKSEGRTDLAAAIVKFGGMSKVSQRLGLKYRVRTREAFKDWTFFRRSLLAFAERHGKPGEIPSSRTLTNFGRDDLYQAILHHGGTRDVADKMGLKRNFWQDFYNVGMQVLEFVGTHGTAGVMPTEGEFLEVGRSALNLAVSKFGHSQVAQRLGLKKPAQSPQVALDAFLNQSMTLDMDYAECDEEDYLDDTRNSEVETSSR